MIANQLLTDQYAIYQSDCMYVLPTLPAQSIDLSIYSPPFLGLYNYSSSDNDFSNCDSKEQFFEQYAFLVAEKARLTKPGRMTIVHCQQIPEKGNKLYPFTARLIDLHERLGFEFFDERYIWKEPLKVALRTRAQGLQHKWIVKDSTKCRSALADILLIFRRSGENQVPVTHASGITHYAGANPMPPYMEKRYGRWDDIVRKYQNTADPRYNKMSQIIWQRYASVFWDDIRVDNVLSYKEGKDGDDEKHVHPLQLDVIDRCVELYSNPGEVVLTPFMGVGSEVYGAVSLGRKAIGIELKDTYYRQAVKNLKEVENRFSGSGPMLFDELSDEVAQHVDIDLL